MYRKKKKPSIETLTKKQAMLIGKIAGGLVGTPRFPTPMSAANQAKFGRKIIKD